MTEKAAAEKAAAEKAAADIEWNGGTACKKKDSLLSFPLERLTHTQARSFLGRALPALRDSRAQSTNMFETLRSRSPVD